MEDFIQLLSIYRRENRLKIIRKVFLENILSEKKLLWTCWLAVLITILISALYVNSTIIVIAILPSICGAFCYRSALYLTFSDLIENEDRKSFVKGYGLNYEGLRYLLFQKASENIGENAFINAVNCLELQDKTRSSKSIKNHWLIAALLAVLSLVIHKLIDTAPQEMLLVIGMILMLVISYSAMLLQVFVSETERNQEFKRFLLWRSVTGYSKFEE